MSIRDKQKLFSLIICGILTLQSFGQISKIQHALLLFNTDSLVNYTKVLTGLKGANETDTIKIRLSASAGNELAFQYAKQLFQNWNLQVDSHQFSINGKNLIATKKGTKSSKYILLGAHYDAVGTSNPIFHYPGADDNASGTSAVLEAARIISQFNFPFTIKFALWDEEEQGLLGSRATGPPDDPRDFMGYINLDMIAWDGNNDSLMEIHTRDIANSNSLVQRVVKVLGQYNICLKYNIINPGDPATDHKSFWDLNLTAIGINEEYEDDFNPNWHKLTDSLSKFNIPYFSKMAQLSIATIMDVALDTIKPLSTTETIYENTVFIYPNPSSEKVYINITANKNSFHSLEILDIAGKQVCKYNDVSTMPIIDTSGFKQGLYFFKFYSDNNLIMIKKIIKL